MITGAHFLLYSKDPEADRAFFRDVLNFRSVNLGHGWLIFALPPAEMAVHPASGDLLQLHGEKSPLGAELYLMCHDLGSTLKALESKQVAHTPIVEAEWGIKTTVRLPSGGEIGLYQPRHETALGLGS